MIFQYRLRPDGSSAFPYASESMAALFQLAADKLQKNASPVLALFQPDVADGAIFSLEKAARELTPWQQEFQVKFADGSVHWFLGNAMGEREADGGTLLHGLCTDITERKQAEATSVQYRQNLEQLIATRTEELSIALADSRQARESLQQEFNEHQRTAVELQQSQLALNQAAQLTQLGAWSIEVEDLEDLISNRAYWSPEMYRLLGYTPQDTPSPTPRLFLARVHPDDRQTLLNTAMRAMEKRTSWQIEFRLIMGDGRERLVLEIGEFIFDDAGNPKSIHGAVKDITTQRQDEAQLRASESLLRQTMEGANAGRYEWNSETGLNSWSPEIWALFAMEPSAKPASHDCWRQAVHPQDRARIDRIIEEAVVLRTGYEVEWRVNMPAGAAPRWLLDRASPTREKDGQGVRYCGIVIDITKRKQAELVLEFYRNQLEKRVVERTVELVISEVEQRRLNRALRLHSECTMAVVHARNEQQLLDEVCRLVVQSGGYLMAWIGMAIDNAFKTVNAVASFGDATGYLDGIEVSWDALQVSGHGPTGTAIRTGLCQVNQDCLNNPQMAPWREAALRRGFQSSLALPLMLDGQCVGALTLYSVDPQTFGLQEVKLLEELARDVAFGLQSLRARVQLERYHHQLEKLVAQRTGEIEALNTELKSKAQMAEAASLAKGAFLATMSHELRTPLNAVIGLSGLLVDSPLNRQQRDYADKILLSGQALRVLIDDILDFSKIEAGELRLEQAPFSLNAVLRTTAAVLGVGVGNKPIEALFDVAPDIPDMLIGDALRLQQILLNLTSNAVKFTSSGVIVVSVRCRLGQQYAEVGAPVTLYLSVRDTGIGIAPEQLGSIFNAFTQADASTSRLYGGSGLGLAISARLATLMGGRVWVDSALDWGSEFHLEVPLILGNHTHLSASESIPLALSVLIVDDHGLARDLLMQTCTALGWQATAVGSGVAGLQALAHSAAQGLDYEVLLLDWHMPGLDGLEMLREVHCRPGIGLPLVVLMASMAELALAVAASDDLGVDAVVAKPLTPNTLLEAVSRAYTGESAVALPLPGKSDRRLAGMRLLVAEDNELNQEVVAQILTRAGAQVTMVSDGLEAVTALRTPQVCFDAVLMDVQMPVLDGYSATRIIREELGLNDLPIIAVTAFAQAHDREKALLAGMVGHVVKPLNVGNLLDLLCKERRSVVSPLLSPGPGSEGMASANGPIGFDIRAALKTFGGDETRYGQLLQKFIVKHGGDVDEARRLVRAEDLDGASRLLHDLCGMAGILRAKELAHLASVSEAALKSDQVDRIPALLYALQAAMQAVKVALSQLEISHVQA